MDKPKQENKVYKKIVPLKGSILQKLKNQLKKEKEIPKKENGSSDSVNNNVEQKLNAIFTQPKSSPENKVIIQKVENVHIDAIKTLQGPVRRISSFFPLTQPNINENVDDISSEIPEVDEIIKQEPAESSAITKVTRSPIKLLTAKMPANTFNQTVPLKITQFIRQPKAKPVFRNRFHRVQTCKEVAEVVTKEVQPPEVQFEILVPDIEMTDQSIVIKQQIDETSRAASSSDEDFLGFDLKENEDLTRDLSLWNEALNDRTSIAPVLKTEENPAQDSAIKQNLTKMLPTVKARKSKKEESKQIIKKALKKELITPSDPKMSLILNDELVLSPIINSTKPKGRAQKKNQLAKKLEFTSTPIIKTKPKEPTQSFNFQEQKDETKITETSSYQSPPTTSKSITVASTSKQAVAENNQSTTSSWQNDIFAVIGTARIKKIDENLKNIPNLLSDNIYETEIIELKLIANHLLRLLKVDSVMDTINLATPQGEHEDDSSDDDDFPDSFGDNSNEPTLFGGQSTEESGEQSTMKENKLRFNSESNLPGTSHSFALETIDEPSKEISTILDIPEITIEPVIPACGEEINSPDTQAQTEQTQETEMDHMEDTSEKKEMSMEDTSEKKEMFMEAEVTPSLIDSNVETEMKPNDDEIPTPIELNENATKKRRKASLSVSKPKRFKEATRRSLRKLDSGSDSSPMRDEVKEPCAKVQSKCVLKKSSVVSENTSEHQKEVLKAQTKPFQVVLSHSECKTSLQSSESGSDSVADSPLKINKQKRGKASEKSIKINEKESVKERVSKSSSKPRRQIKKEKLSKEQKLQSISRCKSLRSSSCGSSSDSSGPLMNKVKPKALPKESVKHTSSESEGIQRRSKKVKPIQPLSDDADDNDDDITELRNEPIKAPAKKRTKQLKIEKFTTILKRKLIRKIVDSESDSDAECDKNEITRNDELKSRLSSPDFNSKANSSKSLRNNCLASVDKKGSDVQSIMSRLSSVISKNKKIDPTYTAPPIFEKRERLKTSAFHGNECSSDEDIQSHSGISTREPSVSRESSVVSNQTSQIKKYNRRKMHVPNDDIHKPEFVQEKLEPAIESQVPYEEIILSIRASVPAKIGRQNQKTKLENEAKAKEQRKKLKELDFFLCGNCKFKITKHKWVQHFLDHGAFAWMEGFEPPIDFTDFNEALRRTINNFKAYKILAAKCPNCKTEKKSALGYLTHLFLCCESEETIESRMITCELCNEKILPFNSTVHKGKCSGIQQIKEELDVAEAEKNFDEDVLPNDFNSSGRKKRQAVKRAEKNFKKILDVLDKPSDHLKVTKGNIKCQLCGEDGFDSHREGIEHINREHKDRDDGVFEGDSSSDEKLQDGDSSDETDGSSGDESSEIESSNDDEDEIDTSDIVSSKKGKVSASEPQEVKNGRAVISEYVDEFRNIKISDKTIHWTNQFIKENWKTEVFPEILPKFKINLTSDLKLLLRSLNFSIDSMKFGKQQLTHYNLNYGAKYHNEWKQLQIGEDSSDQTSSTIYCGGSVAAIDWAPVNGNLSFLAVACNSQRAGVNLSITESIKSCIQVYEFANLFNEKFQGFTDSSKLSFVIIVNDGPIWSIKFHPSTSSIEKRIGLLAVTTSNQSVFIYSLPYLSDQSSIVLSIQPTIVCQLQEEMMLFQDEFLMQATKVAWYQKKNSDTMIAAGFVSGLVGVWNLSQEEFKNSEDKKTVYPHHVVQAHLEPITALDFKATTCSQFHLLTAGMDRKIKYYTLDEIRCQETVCNYAESRVLCAEWMMHWPGFVVGLDECFNVTKLIYRQPLEFGMRNSLLLTLDTTVNHVAINHWLNLVMCVTDAGDVIGCSPSQMLQHHSKDKWSYFNFKFFCSNDVNKIITDDGVEENGIIFGDFKGKISQPKKFRRSPTDRINELQINQVCFNHNEKSYRFYALGFETGFIRIRYLKNSK